MAGVFISRERYLAYSESALQYGLVLLIFLLPSASLRPVKGALLAALAAVWISHMLAARELHLRRTLLDIPLLAYIAWISLSLSTAANVLYSLGEMLKLLVSLFIFYLVVNRVQDTRELRRVVFAIVVTTFAISSYGIFKFFLIQQGSLVNRAVRANSFTPDHHWLSTYLILAIPILLCLMVVQQGVSSKLFLRITCALSVVTLFFTYTRGAWAALLAELLAYGWARRRRLSVMLAAGVVVGGLASLILFSSRGASLPLSPNADILNPYTLVTRLNTSKLAVQAIPEHPLTGIGYGGKAMAKVYKGALEVKEAYHPHNLFIEVTLGIGIPGLIILLWIFSAMLRGTWGEMTRASDEFGRALLLGLGMVVVGVMVSNLFDHMFAGGMAHLFWVLMALATGVNAAQRECKGGAGPSGS